MRRLEEKLWLSGCYRKQAVYNITLVIFEGYKNESTVPCVDRQVCSLWIVLCNIKRANLGFRGRKYPCLLKIKLGRTKDKCQKSPLCSVVNMKTKLIRSWNFFLLGTRKFDKWTVLEKETILKAAQNKSLTPLKGFWGTEHRQKEVRENGKHWDSLKAADCGQCEFPPCTFCNDPTHTFSDTNYQTLGTSETMFRWQLLCGDIF